MSIRKLKRSKTKQASERLKSSQGPESFTRLLQVAHGHHQSGRGEEAEKLYHELIRAFPARASVHNDLGALYHGQGKLAEAAEHYRRSLSIDAFNPQALSNYGLVMQAQGNMAEAIALFERAIKAGPGDVGALTNLGVILHAEGRLAEAAALFRQVLSLDANDVYALNNLAAVSRDQGEFVAAEEAYQQAIALHPAFVEAYTGLGRLFRKLGRFPEAVAAFDKAVKVNPGHADSWRNLAVACTEHDEFDRAITAYEKVTELCGPDGDVLTKLGILHQKAGRLEQAVACYTEALAVSPDFLPAYESLAETLERHNKLDEASDVARRGLERHPDHIPLHVQAAACERRQGKYRAGVARLARFAGAGLEMAEQRLFSFELGRLYDKGGDYEKAYDCFSSANQAARQSSAPVDPDYFFTRMAILREQFSALAAPPEPVSTLSGRGPVFLFGFPRSGTTLLDQILDSHPALQTMEEKDVVAVLENRLMDPFERYLDIWQGLTPETIKTAQDGYFQEVVNHIERKAGTILVDRMPLNTMRAALIWRLFPDARMILAVRHPYDVCLSCFMQDFQINQANVNFFTLEDAAAFYAAVMSLWRVYVEVLPLRVHVVRYEDLVVDLEGETRRILDYLGLPWDDGALQFHEHARNRGRINTASYSQVTEKIYQHARYRWQRYEKYCEPIREKLAPFIKYFGYS